ncbi:MAG: hypothetical protein A2Z18_09510 [Armatimonadetes bacterium RBG_16_58_9]|nr:MAG: hypothetical protein A2Z18_09510 [Armatimonadetes bacterium RBG_16_58_9]
MKTFPLQLDEELHRLARHAAIDEGISLREWIIRAIAGKLHSADETESADSKERNRRNDNS